MGRLAAILISGVDSENLHFWLSSIYSRRGHKNELWGRGLLPNRFMPTQNQGLNLFSRSFSLCWINFGERKYQAIFFWKIFPLFFWTCLLSFIQSQEEMYGLVQYLITLFIHSRLQFPLAQIAASYVPVSSKSNQSGLRNCPWVGAGIGPSHFHKICQLHSNIDVDIVQI